MASSRARIASIVDGLEAREVLKRSEAAPDISFADTASTDWPEYVV